MQRAVCIQKKRPGTLRQAWRLAPAPLGGSGEGRAQRGLVPRGRAVFLASCPWLLRGEGKRMLSALSPALPTGERACPSKLSLTAPASPILSVNPFSALHSRV